MKYNGLSSQEVQELQFKYGLNVLPTDKSVSVIKIFLSQFLNPLVYIISLVGIISLLFREYNEVIFIFLVVILNSIFGFFQEYKTQKTLVALREMVKPKTRALRNGKQQEIEVKELVPGDIVFTANGDKIPADGIILEDVSFSVNEAILTGESESVAKKKGDEVFMGTIVAWGRAVVRVAKTGLATKIGEIAQVIRETVQPPTTLQLRLARFARVLIYIVVLVCTFVFLMGVFLGQDFWQMLRVATILAVAIIPEALLAVVTLILVIGMQKILKKKALIRRILTVETLGSVTTICTDKTGTLTEGKMKVERVDLDNNEDSLRTMCLCNNLSDSLEIALWEYLEKQKGFDAQKLAEKSERVFEIPFNSDYKFMATVNCVTSWSPVEDKNVLHMIEQDKCFLFVKGAPEIILAMTDLSVAKQKLILGKIEEWGNRGLKVLGLASQEISNDSIKEINSKEMPILKWNGLIGLWDPPRQETKEVLAIAQKAGIKIKVVTGDYRQTAQKIMDFLGIKIASENILEGYELERLSDIELKNKMANIYLFTRVTPQQKLRIVTTLQDMGEIVAMTGDGVNDAPALKKSNIGIVVSEASEVAKESADLIMLETNFKTIIFAIEEGRVIFENIKKVIFLMLSNSFVEIIVIAGSIILGWPLPLTIVQILWINLIDDGPGDIILGFEPKEKEIMKEGPKKINEPILGKTQIFLIFIASSLFSIAALFVFWYYGLKQNNLELGRTMAFMVVAFGSILYIFACRTFRKPFWRYEHFWSNKWLFITVMLSLVFQIIITYVPYTQNLLRLVPLNFYHWIVIMSIVITIVLLIEMAKPIKNYKLLKKVFD